MNIGEQIVNEIITQGMVQVASPDPEATHVFAWKANSHDQLSALVQRSAEVEIPSRVRDLFGEALRILGAPDDVSPSELLEWATKQRSAVAELTKERDVAQSKVASLIGSRQTLQDQFDSVCRARDMDQEKLTAASALKEALEGARIELIRQHFAKPEIDHAALITKADAALLAWSNKDKK